MFEAVRAILEVLVVGVVIVFTLHLQNRVTIPMLILILDLERQ